MKQDGSSSPMLPLEISSWIRSFTETGRDVSNQWTEQGDYVYWEDPTSALVTVDESIPQGEVARSTHRADTFPQAGRPRRQDRSHAWDTSIQSNATAKISQDDMESQVVDFAIGFLEGLRCLIRPDENYHEQLTGMPAVDRVPRLLSHHWTADREWIPMIIEDKRLPQRARLYRSGLTTQDQVKDVLDLGMREAKKQAKKQVRRPILTSFSSVCTHALHHQAGYFFTGRRWRHQDTLLMMATVGDWWSFTVAKVTQEFREFRRTHDLQGDDEPPDYVPDTSTLFFQPWSPVVRVSSPESNSQMARVRTWLLAFYQRVNHLRDHHFNRT